MNAELVKAVADLAWPILVAIIFLVMLPAIVSVIRSRSFSISYGDMEISVQDASDQIRKQIEDLQNQFRAFQQTGPDVGAVAARVQTAYKIHKGTILWVDDKPQNNAYEIAKVHDDGWDISTAESTEAALTLLKNRSLVPTLVISDMGRREGITFRKAAGLDLIRALRASHITVPIIIYTSDNATREYREQVEKIGGNGITASPIELFTMIESNAAQRGP